MRKNWLSAAIASAAITAALVGNASSATADAHFDDPPPDKIVIDVVTVNGTGCPPGSAALSVSDDNTAFTVTYSEYLARVGGSSDPVDFRKNCQLGLKVHVPQGFTFGIASADYRGFAHLEPGATAMQKASYYFQGMSETRTSDHELPTPHSDNWQYTDEVEVGAIVYRPCGEERDFNINTEIRVGLGTSDPAKTSFITMDSTDGNINTIYHFAWKTCPR